VKYQVGKMGASEGIGLTVIMSIATIFLSSPAFIAERVGTLAWVVPLVSGTMSIIAIFLLSHLFKRFSGDLLTITEQLLGNTVGKIISIYYMFIFLSSAFFSVREFSENTLLIALPDLSLNVAFICYALSAAAIVYAGIETIGRVVYLYLPFIMGSILILLLAPYPFLEFNYLFPWQGYGLNTLAENSIGLAGTQAGVIILMVFAQSFQTAQTIRTAAIFAIGGMSILHSLIFVVIVMLFGSKVVAEMSLPLLEIARMIHLSRFFQRVEAIYIMVWVSVGILNTAANLFTGLFLLSRLAGLPTIRPLIPAITFIMIELSFLTPDITAFVAVISKIYLSNFFGMLIFPIILFIAEIIKDRRKKSCNGVQ